MRQVLIFGGTSEGRMLSEYLDKRQIRHMVCVATDYGEEVMEHTEYVQIHQGRLDIPAMEALMQGGDYAVVIDATHPYATAVSANVREACRAVKVPYLRYLRDAGRASDAENRIVNRRSENAGKAGRASDRKEVCESTGAQKESGDSSITWVNSAAEAATYLESQPGNIFLTTGSKELHVFTERISDLRRLFIRVLPSASVITECRNLGMEGKQICAMQGPFSAEMNVAMLKQTKAVFLVTKDTGTTGGYPEKEQAAQQLGVHMVVIRRPEEAGLDFEALLGKLGEALGCEFKEANSADDENAAGKVVTVKCGRTAEKDNFAETDKDVTGKDTAARTSYTDEIDSIRLSINENTTLKTEEKEVQENLPVSRSISCIGIGMGNLGTLTHDAAAAIQSAEIIFGAARLLQSVDEMGILSPDQQCVTEYIGTKIHAYLAEHPQYRRIAVLMSGDVGFYSGARGIQEAFAGENVHFYCGISSVVYFASKIPTSWQDAKLLSAHGKQVNLLNSVQRYPKIIMIVSGAKDVERLCAELHEAEMDQVRVTVGTNLSYPEETVTAGHPADFLTVTTTGLHIMMLENPDAKYILTPGMNDETFVRGKVPMTKEEIRILSVAKLQLTEDAIVYDVGAGTGSVSAECARLCTSGCVYAIERNPEGIALIRENAKQLKLSNLIPVEGLAPEAMEDLPKPTHAFIGGSAGNMGKIIDVLRAKNPDIRIVINTIALESISEVLGILKEREIDADIVQICASRSRTLGRYHMMTGQNPVYIISL